MPDLLLADQTRAQEIVHQLADGGTAEFEMTGDLRARRSGGRLPDEVQDHAAVVSRRSIGR